MAEPPQNEETPFDPQSPYACAKVMAYYLARYYRKVHKMFVSTAILFNHTSVRQHTDYLLTRICKQAVEVKSGKRKQIMLGNLDATVDVGHAAEFVKGCFDLMELREPGDWVLATEKGWTIRDLAIRALIKLGVSNPQDKIIIDPVWHRPGLQPQWVGDCRKAHLAFNFKPKHNAGSLVNHLLESNPL